LAALRRIRRQGARLLVDAVPLGELKAGVIVLVAVRPVEELHEVVAVRIVRDPRCGAGKQLTRPLLLELLRKLVLVDLDANADAIDRFLPEFIDLAIPGRWGGRIAQHERPPIGPGTVAVAAALVAEVVK